MYAILADHPAQDARLAGAYLSLVVVFLGITRTFGGYAKTLQKKVPRVP
jgi:hypothetical protein